jgi:hypothetical protein
MAMAAAANFGVALGPAFHHLALGDAQHVDARDRHLLAGRSYAHQLSLVGAACRPAADHLVPFGDDLLGGDLKIGEGAAEYA